MVKHAESVLTLFRIGKGEGEGKKLPYQFFPLHLQTLELAPKTFWLLVLMLCDTGAEF